MKLTHSILTATLWSRHCYLCVTSKAVRVRELNNFASVTQLVNDRAWVSTQAVWLQNVIPARKIFKELAYFSSVPACFVYLRNVTSVGSCVSTRYPDKLRQINTLTKVPALVIKWSWGLGWILPPFLPKHRLMMAGSEREDIETHGCPPSPLCTSYRESSRWRLCCILFRYGTPAIKILLGYPPFHRWGNRFWGNVFLLRGNARTLS